jgi:adenine deaminase
MDAGQTTRYECRRVALGQQLPSLLLKGGRVFSPFTGEFYPADVAICGRLIAGVGDYPTAGSMVIDASGSFIIPGLFDAHVHPETSLLSPPRFAEALVGHGVTTVIAEPHEITNVLGADGIEFYLSARSELPLDLRVMVPSCVPASPFEKAVGRLRRREVAAFLRRRGVQGLGEAMDYLGLVHGAATGLTVETAQGRVIDGHAPDLTGRELAAYMLAGPLTDHETSDPALLLERRRLGMWLLAREGSAARDLDRTIPFLVEYGTERTALCTDDRHAATLAEGHHIDEMVARLVAGGVPLAMALRAATINPATLYRLFGRGAVSPGLRADLLLVKDPAFPHPEVVIFAGKVVSRDGALADSLPPSPPLDSPPFYLAATRPEDLAPPAGQGSHLARAIHLLPGSIVTEERMVDVHAAGGYLHADPEKDVCLVAVMERRARTGEIGTGLISGLGLRRGAIATTVAHDAHHLLVAGVDPADMLAAAQALAAAGGGLAVACGPSLRLLPLPLVGLMTDLPAETVGAELRSLQRAAAELGVQLDEPFMAMSFATLSVIPRLRITLGGLLDVLEQRLVPTVVS